MSNQLRTLLHEAAPSPTRPAEPERIHTRRLRRDSVRAGVAGVAAVAAVAAGVVLTPPVGTEAPVIDQVPQPQPSPSVDSEYGPAIEVAQAEPIAWPDGPSQSPEDAVAQDVPAEIAALPLAHRIELRGGTQASEGLYVTSGVPFDVAEGLADGDGRLSNGTRWDVYEELLLLDPVTLTIQRAWPTAGLSFHESPIVFDDPNVVVASRGADGGEPWTGVIVIDRDTGERRGYVSVPDDVETGSPWMDDDSVTVNQPRILPSSFLGAVDGLLAATGDGGGVTLHDPVTMEPVRDLTRRDGAVTGLARAGEATLIELSDQPHDFLALDTSGISRREDIPAFAATMYVTAADVTGPPLVVSFAEHRRALWVLRDQTWVEVFDGGTYDIALHRTADATWATGYNGRSASVLLRDGDLVAERAHDTAGGQPGHGADVIAARPDGTVLWITRDKPYVVDRGL